MLICYCRCGNVAAILELDENLQNDFLIFEAAPNVSDHFVLTRCIPLGQANIGRRNCL